MPPKKPLARTLDGVFRPRSVAVVGASRSKNGIGYEVVNNLVGHGFEGPVYPVNPRATVVHSMKCYPSLEAIPDRVDLAVIVVPAAHVEAVMRSCVRKHVKGAVIVSAGFRETGAKGLERENRVVDIAREGGIRVVGPNCMGIINTEPDVRLNASFARTAPTRGDIGFVSQSGALGEAILADAKDRGLGVRMFASVGNRADIGAHDLLEYWEDDPGVRLILLYLESFGDPARFKAVAERLRGRKPIIAVKSGRSRAGARAAGSHTGSVAGEDRSIDAFLRQCGVVRAESMREMWSTAQALLHQPVPRGEQIAVVTNAGGPGILATDALVGSGFQLATFGVATKRRLANVLPKEASSENPVDLIASADAKRYEGALRAVLADPNVHALIVLFVSPIMIDAEAVAAAIVAETKRAKKPVVACIMGRQRNDEAVQLLESAGIPTFRFPEDAARTLTGLVAYANQLSRPVLHARKLHVDQGRVSQVLGKKTVKGGRWLESGEVREVLAAYGFPMIPARTVTKAEDAVQAADELGYPVAIKATAKALVHKSDVGGVALGLENGGQVREAARRIRKELGKRYRGLKLEVQLMGSGLRELLLGFRRDPKLGPVLAVGLGGTTVEVLGDVVLRIAPLHDPAAMLDELRGAPLLGEFRGDPPIERRLVEQCLLRMSQLAMDFPEITELDINPFLAAPRGTQSWVLDARMFVE